jgi:glycosyltransferase involved in cell wall biosynthesis
LKHHPNDPSLYRRIAAAGHRVRILGGLLLAPAFKADAPGPQVELIAEEAIDARQFLDSLDCFVYRTHPHYVEAGGSVILEAMAMELPVIAFRGPIGNTDLITNGENGFIVDSENEALALIDELAANPARRLAIGRAARKSLVNTLEMQRTALLSFYLPGIDIELAASNSPGGRMSA